MKLYIASSSRGLTENREVVAQVVDTTHALGHEILDSWTVVKLLDKPHTDSVNETVLENSKLLIGCDAMILEGSHPSIGVGYQLAHALSAGKPILCLYPEGITEEEVSDVVKGSTSSKITLAFYNSETLTKIIKDFLAGIELDSLRKFNFIASEQIMEYIEKGARRERKSKSEFLRDILLKSVINKE